MEIFEFQVQVSLEWTMRNSLSMWQQQNKCVNLIVLRTEYESA